MLEQLEGAFHRAYPSSLEVADGERRPLILRYNNGREFWVDEDRTTAGRTTSGWLMNSDGERIGALRFAEWHPAPFLSNKEFFWAMDELSQAACNVAEVLTDVWNMEELSQLGPVLEFSNLWMHPDHAKGSVWAPTAEALIRRRYRSRFSVMVLKAFPLEYEASAQEGQPMAQALALRQKAMERLYARVLGVQPLPGAHGADGWMWRPLRDDAPRPRQRAPSRKRSR